MCTTAPLRALHSEQQALQFFDGKERTAHPHPGACTEDGQLACRPVTVKWPRLRPRSRWAPKAATVCIRQLLQLGVLIWKVGTRLGWARGVVVGIRSHRSDVPEESRLHRRAHCCYFANVITIVYGIKAVCSRSSPVPTQDV